ncbi:cytochrome P450 [Mycena maculata]|uniref:Cytochrome P450 n=1 Tax=Mycena maculata TaxID=230809 RepID=A0AAD7IU21_9AGAR|nr:cytochrome P450 [Mycena maculata]
MSLLTVSMVAVGLITTIVYRFFHTLNNVNYIPGMRPLFAPMSLFGAAFGTRWWNPGMNWPWEWRKTAFFNHTHDIISVVPLISGGASVYTCSVDVARQLLGSEGKTQLFKPRWIVAGLLLWGDNILAASGDMWRRHRRVVAPAFTSKTYDLVVSETIATYNEMIEGENWRQDGEFLVTDFNRLPRKLALILIARCGFGLHMPWVDPPADENGLTFGQSLTIVTDTVIPRLIIPSWLYKLPIKRLRTINQAWSGLGSFMRTFVETRKDEQRGDTGSMQRGDILSRLVAATYADGKLNLDEQEVIGNVFTLTFAGHDTTAAVISATLGFLAIHEEEQEKAYAEIMKIIPPGKNPTLDDLQKLPFLLACFHESMRIYRVTFVFLAMRCLLRNVTPAAGFAIVRELTDDITVQVKRPAEQTVVLRRGTLVIVDMIALHHNPVIFPDPETFKPSRWAGLPEHDISMFGFGARACIGRKFSHAEALCFLALFLRDWKITAPISAGESRRGYEERVMGKAGSIGLAFGVGPLSLKMARRK